MFISRRKEACRYLFTTPVNCRFEIIQVNGSGLTNTVAYAAKLIDFSRNGCRIETKLNLNCKATRTQIRLSFRCDNQDVTVVGFLQWQQSSLSYHSYGILFDKVNCLSPTIIEELKTIAKAAKNSPKVS